RDELPSKIKEPFHMGRNLPLKMPINAPSFALNHVTISAFNQLYYSSYKDEQKIVPLGSFFHPLDAIDDWNKLYGKNGFIQFQAVIPKENEPRSEEHTSELQSRFDLVC